MLHAMDKNPITWTAQYKKTVIPIQLAILTVCAVLHFGQGAPLLAVLAFFIVMQFGAILGAVFGAKKLRESARRDRLPPMK